MKQKKKMSKKARQQEKPEEEEETTPKKPTSTEKKKKTPGQLEWLGFGWVSAGLAGLAGFRLGWVGVFS
jgi:hypothetical protein